MAQLSTSGGGFVKSHNADWPCPVCGRRIPITISGPTTGIAITPSITPAQPVEQPSNVRSVGALTFYVDGSALKAHLLTHYQHPGEPLSEAA